MVNHDNDTVRSITQSKLYSPRSIIGENYRYLLYKYKFSHLDFYSDIGNIVNKIKVEANDDYISHTVKELIELRDHVSECSIVSPKIIYLLLGELCTE